MSRITRTIGNIQIHEVLQPAINGVHEQRMRPLSDLLYIAVFDEQSNLTHHISIIVQFRHIVWQANHTVQHFISIDLQFAPGSIERIALAVSNSQ